MPRIRYLKPDFFDDMELCGLKPLARILFAGLWCWADREGRLLDEPVRLKKNILGYDSCNVGKLLDDLEGIGAIARYESDGRRYIWVRNFKRHQRPHTRELPSTYPAHPEDVPEQGLGDAQARPRRAGTDKGTNTDTGTGTRTVLPHPSGERSLTLRLYEGMGWTAAPNVLHLLEEIDAEYEDEWIGSAFELAAAARARNLKYVTAILEHWKDHGRDCECQKPKPKGELPFVSAFAEGAHG